MSRLPKDLTAPILRQLTLKHIARYTQMISIAESGQGRNIRLGECKQLLSIWNEIAIAVGSLDPKDYSLEAQNEIADAYNNEY